jgi:hypothetical protein
MRTTPFPAAHRLGAAHAGAITLAMTLVVRNEADIIEANLDYHLAQGVDVVLVTDHGSDDGTNEILSRYESAGVVHLIVDSQEGHHQSLRVNRMVRLAAERYSADWVINNDADEFWWPLAGSLRDIFESIPEQFGQIAVQRRDFIPRPDGPGPFYERMVYRDAQSLNPRGLPLESKVAHRPREDVVVAPGNHSVCADGLRPVPYGELLEIFHFPMRSYPQFERKVLKTGFGYEQLGDRAADTGIDQLFLLERQRTGELPDYYGEHLRDESALARGLREGGIVRDERLSVFMSALDERRQPSARPDSAGVRALSSNMLELAYELEQREGDLTHLEQELEEAQAQTADLRGARARLEDGVAELNEEAAKLTGEAAKLTGEAAKLREEVAQLRDAAAEAVVRLEASESALHALRASRLLRLTGPMRRAYYRAREAGRR